MKKIILFTFLTFIGALCLFAQEDSKQRLTPEEFRKKQAEYISNRASLTDEEAARFFPVYFELQDKKRALSHRAWQDIKRTRTEKFTEEQYNELIYKMVNSRLNSDRLEKAYLSRFKAIISCEKIFKVQAAEMRFHREMLKGFGRKNTCPNE